MYWNDKEGKKSKNRKILKQKGEKMLEIIQKSHNKNLTKRIRFNNLKYLTRMQGFNSNSIPKTFVFIKNRSKMESNLSDRTKITSVLRKQFTFHFLLVFNSI